LQRLTAQKILIIGAPPLFMMGFIGVATYTVSVVRPLPAACCVLQQDLADAQAHAAANGHDGELLWWDVAFWAERLREAKYDLKDEELRPYFALPAVLDGLFKVGNC
jgi:hypothetical protein